MTPITRTTLALMAPALFVTAVACGGTDDDGIAFGLGSDVVAEAERVSEIAVAPDGRIFFAEQISGNIRVIQADGIVQQQPFATVNAADYIQLDWGLTGLALDPDFESNGYVYAFYTEPVSEAEGDAGPTARPKLVRFTDDNGVGTDETVISEDFPETLDNHPGYNANGEIHFGPDGFLYASLGDYDDYENPENPVQDLSTVIGKLLRLDPSDGSAAEGNPFEDDADADPRIYAYGFRDPFSFTFGPDGTIYGADNTTVSCEELNIIEAGANYGWPAGEFPFDNCDVGEQGRVIYHFAREGLEPPNFISFVEVSGMGFTSASRYPTLGDSLIVCESWRSADSEGLFDPGVLRRVVLGGTGDQVTMSDVIVNDCKGTTTVAPDGTIYYANDTEIRRLNTDGGGDGGGAADDGGDDGPTQPVPVPVGT